MPQPTANDVHFNEPLTNLSVGFMQDQDDYIAGQVFPIIPSETRSNDFVKYNKGDWFRSDAQRRAPGTMSEGTGYKLDNLGTFTTEQWAVHQEIPDEVADNANEVIEVDENAVNLVTHDLLLRREKEWVSNFFTTGVWDRDLDGSGADFDQIDDSASTPIQLIDDEKQRIKEKTGKDANVLVMGPKVFREFKNHSNVLDRIKHTQTGLVTEDLLASLLGVERVLVPSPTEDTANEGQSESMSFLYGKQMLLCHAAPRPGRFTASAGYIFTWSGHGNNDLGVAIRTIRDEKRTKDIVEGRMSWDMKAVATSLGTFFDKAIS